MACHCTSGAHGELLCTSKITLFSSLPLAVQETIVSDAIHSDYAKGHTLFRQNDVCESMYIIREGKVKLSYIDIDGKEIIIDILVDGELIGDNLFLEKGQFAYDAVCISDTKICEIRRTAFEKVLKENPSLALNMITTLSKKLNDQEEKIKILSENDARKRLATYLMTRANRIHASNIRLTVEEIASSINLRPETVSRKIKEMVDEGILVRVGKRSLSIADLEALKEILDF